ncbi:MAG: hypothetical protein M3019_02060 [Candidatus Dormibacteraeota bacterium]|nr:hypothetical protein [Candidatus Dormibacteraeota bacterium]
MALATPLGGCLVDRTVDGAPAADHHGVRTLLAASGTWVRELLRDGEALPAEFTRSDVAEILRSACAGAPVESAP